MKKAVAVLISVIMLFGSMTVWAENVTDEEVNAFLAKYGVTDSEYIKEFLSTFSVDEELGDLVDIPQLYASYVVNRKNDGQDGSYLVTAPKTYTETTINPENVTRVLWLWNQDGLVDFRLLDLRTGMLYYASDLLSTLSAAHAKIMNEWGASHLVSDLVSNHVETWKENYTSAIDNTTAWFYWRLAIEMQDGRVFVSSGSGSTEDCIPPEYSQVKSCIDGLITGLYDSRPTTTRRGEVKVYEEDKKGARVVVTLRKGRDVLIVGETDTSYRIQVDINGAIKEGFVEKDALNE